MNASNPRAIKSQSSQMNSRLTFQEAMRLAPLPPKSMDDKQKGIKRYMSIRAAWLPASDLREADELPAALKAILPTHKAAFGAHVYCQSGMAAATALRESKPVQGTDVRQYGIHVRNRPFMVP
jgi:hypothetical protein